jgi:PAS domain S-box-containing protein
VEHLRIIQAKTSLNIRTQVLGLALSVVLLTTVLFTYLVYQAQEQALLDGIDKQLLAAAQFASFVLPPDYHDNIVDAHSISSEDYLRIVDTWNRLCVRLDLQYIWSLMVMNDVIVFTSSTSPSKDVEHADYAAFFEVHTNPDAYTEAFRAMKIQYSTFHDKWGAGRMVLVPAYDRHGHKFLFAASKRLDFVEAQLRNKFILSITIGGAMLLLGSLFSIILANSLTKPVIQLTRAAGNIAEGEFNQKIEPKGSTELISLARSLTRMRDTIRNSLTQLKESEIKFRTIFASAGDVMFIHDDHGHILEVNDIACERLGFFRHEFLDKKISDITDPQFSTDFPQLIEAIKNDGSALHESILLGRDGQHIFVENSSQWIDYGGIKAILATARDITERKQAEEALRVSEERLERALNGAELGLWDLDFIEDSETHDKRWAAMLGYTLQEIQDQGIRWKFLVHPDDYDEAERRLKACLDGETDFYTSEHRLKTKSGEWKWILSKGKVVERDAAGRALRAVGTHLDITERKQAETLINDQNERLLAQNEKLTSQARALRKMEAELRSLNAELEKRVQERTAQLQAANNEMEAFSYSVSHDLRSPLRAIDGFSQALQEDYGVMLDEQGKHNLERVREGAHHMGHLIDDLLRLSRLSRTEMHIVEVNLSEMVQDIADELLESQPDRAVDFIITPDVKVNADENLMHVVLENLMHNAWKYTSKHPQARIEFGTFLREGRTFYFVRDDGAGFDMSHAKKLFGAFQRLHRSSDFEGTGIGLAIVQRVIQRHAGRIWADAAVERGATFYFSIP